MANCFQNRLRACSTSSGLLTRIPHKFTSSIYLPNHQTHQHFWSKTFCYMCVSRYRITKSKQDQFKWRFVVFKLNKSKIENIFNLFFYWYFRSRELNMRLMVPLDYREERGLLIYEDRFQKFPHSISRAQSWNRMIKKTSLIFGYICPKLRGAFCSHSTKK